MHDPYGYFDIELSNPSARFLTISEMGVVTDPTGNYEMGGIHARNYALEGDFVSAVGNRVGTLVYADRSTEVDFSGGTPDLTTEQSRFHLRAGWNLVTRTFRGFDSSGLYMFTREVIGFDDIDWYYSPY